MPLEVKGARTRLGYTQSYMAERLGISVGSYQKKESGKIPFTESQKIGVANILGFDIIQMNVFLFDGKLPIGNLDVVCGQHCRGYSHGSAGRSE